MNKLINFVVPVVVAILLPHVCWAASSDAPKQTSSTSVANQQDLLEWADAHNPELAVMNYEIEAAESRIVPAGALPDPTLRATFMNFAGPGSPDGFNPLLGQGGGTQYRFGQTIPWWGKRDLRTEIASAGLEEVKLRRTALLAEIHSKIKIAYAQFYQPFGLKKLNQDILKLLQDIEAVTRIRYSNGLVPQQDVIRAQVEKTMLRSEIIALDANQKRAKAQLNAIAGRPQQAPISDPQLLQHQLQKKLDTEALQVKVQRNNPQLRTQDAQIAAADANQRLVEKNRYPDVTLMVSPTQRGSNIDSWEAMVEVNIPIRFDTRRAQEAEASAMLSAAKGQQQVIANNVLGQLQETLAAYEAASEQELLITNTLIPQAELTFRSALAGYENGKVDFATLLDAQRSIWRAKQDGIKAQVEQAVRLAEIERMIGEEL